MNKEYLTLAGILNENISGDSKMYSTADSEIKKLELGKEILIRDVSKGPTSFLRVRVSKFLDKDHIEVIGVKSNKTRVFNTNDCEIDLPGDSTYL